MSRTRWLVSIAAASIILSGCSGGVDEVLNVGDCYNWDISEDGTEEIHDIVSCSEPHFAEVVGTFTEDEFNAMDTDIVYSGAFCDEVFSDYVGISPDDSESYYVWWDFEPATESMVCAAISLWGDDITGSVKGAAE